MVDNRSSKQSGDNGEENNDGNRGHVWATWNEERNDEFPQVLEYRSGWKELGYDVQVTPNEDIRLDVLRLMKETNGEDNNLLKVFDSLETTNMQFDFWRYTKLYLDGGFYADVDVQPLSEIQQWQQKAQEQESVVIFEESPSWMAKSMIAKLVRPLISNFQEYPSYASCMVISPGPRSPFFLDILRQVNPDEWRHVREPRKTLMMVGPGHLTRFAKTRNDVIVASRHEAKQAYVHRGFGTWKPASTLAFEKYGRYIPVLWILLGGLAVLHWKKRRLFFAKGNNNAEGDVVVVGDEESQPLPITKKPEGADETESNCVQRKRSANNFVDGPF